MSDALRTRTRSIKVNSEKSLIRTEVMDGRTYTVAPVVPLREGVHNGEFISFEEIAVFPEAWDGRPLPIDHPSDSDGIAITANSPKIMESSVVGFLFNVEAREDLRGISGEIWIDVLKAATVPGGQESLRKLNDGEGLEVSTAYYTFIDKIPGEWKNPDGTIAKFTGSQNGLRPDHLALLPFDTGACSWKDGCGAPRKNTEVKKKIDDHVLVSKKDTTSMPDSEVKKNLQINGKQLGIALKSALAAHNGEDGTPSAMIDRLAVAANINKAKVEALVAGSIDFAPRTWLAIFAAVLDVDPWDIFAAASNDNGNARFDANGKKIDDQGVASLKDSKTETQVDDCGCKKTLAVKVKEIVVNTLTSLGISKIDAEQEKTMEKKQRVDALIASDKTQFSENHREWLTSLNDDQLAVLEPKAEVTAPVKAVEVVNAAEVVKTVEVVKEVPAAITKEQILAALGADNVAALEVAKASIEAGKVARNAKIAEIAAIEGCVYSKEELVNFSDSMLDKTLNSLQPETPFRTAAGVQRAAKNEVPAEPAILLDVEGAKKDRDERLATDARRAR